MTLNTHSTMEELSARVEEIAAKVAALGANMDAITARMDALESPSLPGTDSQRSSPSQTRADAPISPKPFSFAPTNKEFGLPKQSQPTTSIFTTASLVSSSSSSGKNGLFSDLPPRTGSAQSQTNIFDQRPMFSLTSAGTDSFQNQSQINIDSAVPSTTSFFSPLKDPKTRHKHHLPQDLPQVFRWDGVRHRGYQLPQLRLSSFLSSQTVLIRVVRKSLKSSQRMNDIAAAMAADFTQLSLTLAAKHSQDICAATAVDFAELLASARISHASFNCNNEAWIRHRLIEAKEPILFVGESKNRSLPVALAIMRESWEGIWASSQYKEETQTLPALLASAQDRSQSNGGILFRRKKSSPWKAVPEMRHKLSQLTDALDPKSRDQIAARLSLVVDATKLKTSIEGPTRNIWFQCPWISQNDNSLNRTTTAKLLEGFISSAAAVQKSGDAVFLGLTERTEYRSRYDLENLKKVAHRLGYEIFVDEWFILHAIDAGYMHKSVATTDIHRRLIDSHQTFVLVKREHSEHISVMEQISTLRKAIDVQKEVLIRHQLDLCGRELELVRVDEAMTRMILTPADEPTRKFGRIWHPAEVQTQPPNRLHCAILPPGVGGSHETLD
ncbi:hypothetical protein C8J57DRAFT_1483094 [Mycena rebaudengoi]|nr:hypothetical protein C8J57DRAFT_1483094 [Mycena rebaudengoi]